MTEDDIPAAVPAATLVLFRDRDGMHPEILMVERSKGMAFAGGAVVFPGGRVDEDDALLARRYPDYHPEDGAARIAAIRETIEESLIPVGLRGGVDDAWLAMAREHLHARKPFSVLIDAAGLEFDLDALVPFAHWRPKHREARVFDTRFYIARAPHDLPPPVVDDTENVRTFWESAARVLELADEDRVKVIFPTRRNLERLALFDCFDSANAHARSIEIRMISPWHEVREGESFLCINDDQGYPVTAEPFSTVQSAYQAKPPGK
jgi:8-oxo-dGTP pyrophosphatase MutT (NUDIX family)